MKIFILQVDKKFQPDKLPFPYPSYNSEFGVEQDFLSYLENNPNLVTLDESEADWFYLPIFWTRWHVNHNYASECLQELQNEVSKFESDKIFTVCQYDDGPVVDLGNALIFYASRKEKEGLDIPLLASDLPYNHNVVSERYLASFVGRLSTHPVRSQMAELLKNRNDINIVDGNCGIDFFINQMLESRIALCPRGYGGSSFRFFEAMQLGTVPMLIGDIDTRPFKNWVNWSECSFYLEDVNKINEFLDVVKNVDLNLMGENARMVRKELGYGKWPIFVIMELENLK